MKIAMWKTGQLAVGENHMDLESGCTIMNEVGYHVTLGDGQDWHIVACRDLSPWVGRLAVIMQLEVCEPNGYPRLLFVRRESEGDQYGEPSTRLEESVVAELPRGNWKADEIGDIRFWSRPDEMTVICEIEKGDENLGIVMMRHSLYPIYQRAQALGGLPLHGALVEWNGMGIILAASKNTGKSTCCRRLRNSWKVLGDEETLVVQDAQRQYLAHPFPTWSNYFMKGGQRTWDVQKYVPLAAILFLEQAETDEVVPIGQGQTAMLISRSATEVCHRDWVYLDCEEVRPLRERLFENACNLAKEIPAYNLRVSRKGRFWKEMEKVLSQTTK